jgi:hypothetical protein
MHSELRPVDMPDADSAQAHLDAALSPGAANGSQGRLPIPALKSHQSEYSNGGSRAGAVDETLRLVDVEHTDDVTVFLHVSGPAPFPPRAAGNSLQPGDADAR